MSCCPQGDNVVLISKVSCAMDDKLSGDKIFIQGLNIKFEGLDSCGVKY